MRLYHLLAELRYGLRVLRRSPGSTLIAVLTLAIGIAGTTTLFSFVYAVLLRPLPYPDPDRLVQLWQYDPGRPDVNIRPTPANIADWRAQTVSFADIAVSTAWVGSNSWGVIGPDGNERVTATYVSANFFRVYGVRPLLGRTFSDDEDAPNHAPTVVISHRFWQSHFGGDPAVIGKTITFDTYWKRAHAIVGVMPAGFDVPAHDDIWMPIGLSQIRADSGGASPNRCCPWFHVVARLKPGVTLAQARADVSAVAARIAKAYPEADFGTSVKVVPLQEERVRDVRLGLLLLFGAVGCVLLIACVNVANLQLGRAAARQREIGIRTALGARASDIARQMLVESVVLSAIGGALGTVLAMWGMYTARAITAGYASGNISVRMPTPLASRFSEVSGAVSLDPVVLAFSVALTLAIGILFGLAPAWHATRVRPQDALKQTGSTSSPGRAHARIRRALVIGEIAMALVLLTSANLLVRSLLRLQQIDPGFRPAHLLVADIDMTSTAFDSSNPSRQFFDAWKLRVSAHAGVLSVSGITSAPMTETADGGSYDTSVTPEGQPFRSMSQTPRADRTAITADYFRTLGIPLLKGRAFTADDRADRPSVAIITKTMAAQLWPSEDPVGKRFSSLSRESLARFLAMNARDGREPPVPWTTVVGVVADVRQAGLAVTPRPQMYVPYQQFPWQTAQLIVRTTGEPLALASLLRADARALNPHAMVTRVQTMDDAIDASTASPRLGAGVATLFAAIGALLAALGLYGVMAHSVMARTREIGIRVALGAPRGRVLALILQQALGMTLTGIAIGAIGFMLASRVIATVLFNTSPADPVAIAGTVALLVGVALAAASIPARRATRVDPLVALRHE